MLVYDLDENYYGKRNRNMFVQEMTTQPVIKSTIDRAAISLYGHIS